MRCCVASMNHVDYIYTRRVGLLISASKAIVQPIQLILRGAKRVKHSMNRKLALFLWFLGAFGEKDGDCSVKPPGALRCFSAAVSISDVLNLIVLELQIQRRDF